MAQNYCFGWCHHEILAQMLNYKQDIEHLAHMSDHATVSVEVKQYQENIVSFLRLHRAVAGGVSAVATKHFDKLAKYVCLLRTSIFMLTAQMPCTTS
jgi:hypothetical protein